MKYMYINVWVDLNGNSLIVMAPETYHFAFIFGLKSEECYQLFVMTLESK